MVGALLLETVAPGISWSPYYKITTEDVQDPVNGTRVYISVNGVPHQSMSPAEWKLTRASEIYRAPYEHRADAPLRNVLIIGAGSGSDVAIALAKGAEHVDAVDIDPRIMQIGVERNPDDAYQDPRVDRHINDGRAFLRDHRQQVRPDPVRAARLAGAGQRRVADPAGVLPVHRGGPAAARDHLTDDGVFAMYNYYREDWLIDRLGGTAQRRSATTPCIDTVLRRTAVVVGGEGPGQPDAAAPTTTTCRRRHVAPATDDAPFLYYRRRHAARAIYLWALGGILLISLLAGADPRRAASARCGPYADLFFMGAAFLLLETKNIATFALLFGTTWIVNAMVFAGVLLIVLAAVETTRRFRTPPLPVVFAGIAVSLALAYVVQPEWLLALPFWPRLVAACCWRSCRSTSRTSRSPSGSQQADDSQAAFGINLLGAIVGGCLEYAALLTGYRNLLIVVGVLYLVAFLLKPKETLALTPGVRSA